MYAIKNTSPTNPMYYSEAQDMFVRRHWADKFATEAEARRSAHLNSLSYFVIVKLA